MRNSGSRKALVIALVTSLTMGAIRLWAGHTLDAQQAATLANWLKANPGFHAATDGDCACSEDIQQMRTGYGDAAYAVADYHPYRVTGDFNGDGKPDFAVAVIHSSGRVELIVFSGSLRATLPFAASIRDLQHRGLFFNDRGPKPHRLEMGVFQSDDIVELIPRGSSYAWAAPR